MSCNTYGSFAGETFITMANNSTKMIKNLVKGDSVLTLNNPYNNKTTTYANVICLIQIYSDKEFNLITFKKYNDLKIGPWHPIIYNDHWEYPSHITSNVTSEKHNCIYNVILDNGHTILVNNIWAITLGHEYKVGIIAHHYYGSKRIVNDLKNISGCDDGFIQLNTKQFIRDIISNDVIAIKNVHPLYEQPLSFDTPL